MRWRSAVVGHQPQAEILTPRDRQVAHRSIPDDRFGIELSLTPHRCTDRVQPCKKASSLPGLKVCYRDDRQIGVALAVYPRPPDDDERSARRQACYRARLSVHRHFDKSPCRKLRDRAKWLECCGRGKLGEHGAISGPVSRMICTDDHVGLTSEADTRNRHFKWTHADAGWLDGQIIPANCQKIQAHAVLRIASVRCRNRVERTVQTSYCVTK